MSLKTTVITDKIDSYLQEKFAPQSEFLPRITRTAEVKGMPSIQISAHEAKFLQLLLKSINAKYVLEIGSLAGYSAIAMAEVLPDDGKLIAVELNPDYADLIRKNAEMAGLSHKIEVVNQDARVYVSEMKPEFKFDFVFADADKPGYYHYLKAVTPHIRKGGIFAADNALAFGYLLDAAPERNPEDVSSVKSFNEVFLTDPNYFVNLIPIGDGVILGIKETD